MIKAVIFDCFGVLTADKWKEFVETLPDNQRQPAKDLNHAYDSGRLSEKVFLEKIKKLTGRDPGEVENLSEQEIGKNRKLLNYVAELKKEYKIGMLSNVATNWVRNYFLSDEEQQLFDVMVFSFEAGTTKPDPNIYLEVVRKLNTKPQETVFVDDIELYCEAARDLGMKAVRYENFQQMKTELEKILTSP